ncbi:Ca-activated chloride channel family protein [Actinoplanes lutulentus]|uniref:Ca-activated chloride channel family protein n=1 Tax=Actinoplanes lutulentus TaxID=1287878 RepID=A0A327Z3B6_9ACTN|nr:VWA domain-containing protein [Actinoplanes lutulentus]MBB2946354.1 Ca-activated chloride channel family protein [Actinoplanes lutulentus]RAK28706.1 Ca-activated chloride channel family protein [Actinoplanes lutulentus]
MSWLSPERLWLLAAVAALAVAYVITQRRSSRYAVRFTNLRLLDRVAPKRPGWRRHVPASLFLAMLALLVVGFARPQAEVQVPRERATVLVAVDVSRSMLAGDVAPNRLSAAKDAARQFVADLPEQFNVGLVGFAGSASVFVPPVPDRFTVNAGIDRLAEGAAGQSGTAIGDAITTSLDAIRTLDTEAGEDVPPARVVVLSDGANTAGQDPNEAARLAGELGVPVDTISFGTATGVIEGGQAVPVDGQTLQAVAETTGGNYFEAGSADELRAAYADIGSSVGYQTEVQDVSARFIGIGLVLAVLAALASLFWFARLP